MTYEEREMIVARVIAGHFVFNIGTETYIIKQPTPEISYLANKLYFSILENSKYEDVYHSSEIIDFLFDNKIWTPELEKELTTVSTDIDKLKKELYKNRNKSAVLGKSKAYLSKAKTRQRELVEIKSSYDYMTIEYVANSAKTRFIIAESIYRFDGTKYSGTTENTTILVDKILEEYSDNLITERQIREISRTEPWRSIWSARKSGSPVFDGSASRFSNEQRTLLVWSTIHDNIFEAEDCPEDKWFEDDDVIDGYLLIKADEHKSNKKKNAGEFVQNEKIRNASEIYIKTADKDNPENPTLKEIEELNDDMSRMIKRQRSNALKKKGTLNDRELPDQSQRWAMEMSQMIHKKG